MTKIIFVSFEPGTRGHHIARVVAALPHVYWYSHTDNGVHPWNLASAKDTTIRQRKQFHNHFDRIVPLGKLPPTWDYVHRFFPKEDEYYNNIFFPKFNELTQGIGQSLIYCSHSLPATLRNYFPDSKILNIVESADVTVDKYTSTTAHFPGYVRAAEIVPEDNSWLQYSKRLSFLKKDYTIADLWAWENYYRFYEKDMAEKYRAYLLEKYEKKIEQRRLPVNNVLQIRMQPDWRSIKDFLLD
tara:strand:- start:9652 stop:10377 length:726 start_codon:yes stop_codon:yes gene_type:complete